LEETWTWSWDCGSGQSAGAEDFSPFLHVIFKLKVVSTRGMVKIKHQQKVVEIT